MTNPTQEGACDHLATKADVEGVHSGVESLHADIERFRADFTRKLRLLGIAIISAYAVMMSVVVAVIKLTC